MMWRAAPTSGTAGQVPLRTTTRLATAMWRLAAVAVRLAAAGALLWVVRVAGVGVIAGCR
ncbi:hypothetical protein GCM10009827_020020 [Dactylosporangium maewongense]|uniref:Uncharacterized protein n=1 Tax=Dactylosporangium maewongense TaxID=634393 RepID=A0ABN1ZWS6_9ACTN